MSDTHDTAAGDAGQHDTDPYGTDPYDTDQLAGTGSGTRYPDTAEEKAEGPQAGRHPLNVTHLVMGIVFAGFVGIWAALAGDLVEGDDVRWLLPVPWVMAGVAGLLAITFGGRRSTGQQHR